MRSLLTQLVLTVTLTAALAVTSLAADHPQVRTLWESFAFPMTQQDVEGIAERLGLSREQTIAFEREYEHYLNDANAARREAIDAMFKVDPLVFRLPNVAGVPPAEVKRAVSIRRGFLQQLASLEEALCNTLHETLSNAQQDLLPRERLRRERERYASDRWVSQWWPQGGWAGSSQGGRQWGPPTLIELREVVEGMELEPDLRAGLEPILQQYEAAATQQVKKVFDAAAEAREIWPTIEERLFSPEYNERLLRALALPVVAGAALISLEYEWVERMTAALPVEAAAELLRAHARTVAPNFVADWIVDDYYEAAMELGDLTQAERTALQALHRDRQERMHAMLPDAIKARRLSMLAEAGLYLGGINHRVDREHLPSEMAEHYGRRMEPLQALRNAVREQYREALDGDRASLASNGANERYNARRGDPSRSGFAPESNFLGMHDVFFPRYFLPHAVTAAELESVLQQLGLDENSIAIIQSVNDDRARAHAAALREAEATFQKLANAAWGADDDADAAIRSIYDQYRRTFDTLAAEDATFIDLVGLTLDGLDEEAAMVIRLGRTWAGIAALPPGAPVPSNKNSLRPTLSSHIDRVNAVNALLATGASLAQLEPALKELAERTPAMQEAANALRRSIIDAAEAAGLMAAAIQKMTQGSQTWQQTQPARDRQANAALAAAAQRRKLFRLLRETHDAVIVALDGETAARYRDELRRIAYPTLARPLDRAAAQFDAALKLPDLSDGLEPLATAATNHRQRLIAAAEDAAALIHAFTLADDFLPESEIPLAKLAAEFEQALFELESRADGARRALRPILTAEQMQTLDIRR